MHDHSTVLAIDLSIFSIGAIHSGLPVSFRNRIAFRRSRTGWYVSGTNRTIRQSYQANVSLWCTWCAAQPYLDSRPDDEHVETPVFMSTHRRLLPRDLIQVLSIEHQGRIRPAGPTPSDLHAQCRKVGLWALNKHLPSPRSVLNDEASY
jgi:hypothetical protein